MVGGCEGELRGTAVKVSLPNVIRLGNPFDAWQRRFPMTAIPGREAGVTCYQGLDRNLH